MPHLPGKEGRAEVVVLEFVVVEVVGGGSWRWPSCLAPSINRCRKFMGDALVSCGTDEVE